jgi:riboflavin kinase / FMN adenylyltransferase
MMVVDWVQGADNPDHRISSTHIRELVINGRMAQARKMLGRPYQIRGVVAAGRNRGGRLLGVPHGQYRSRGRIVFPRIGIYAVTVEHRRPSLPGVANIGYSPTFDDHLFTIEVHILDFNKDIYNDPIRVNFIQRLRDEIKFDGIDALAAQIHEDVALAREILADSM